MEAGYFRGLHGNTLCMHSLSAGKCRMFDGMLEEAEERKRNRTWRSLYKVDQKGTN